MFGLVIRFRHAGQLQSSGKVEQRKKGTAATETFTTTVNSGLLVLSHLFFFDKFIDCHENHSLIYISPHRTHIKQ